MLKMNPLVKYLCDSQRILFLMVYKYQMEVGSREKETLSDRALDEKLIYSITLCKSVLKIIRVKN